MSLMSFLDEAPCRNLDPWLFDQHQIDLARPALEVCKSCPFWKDCDDWVAPRANYFDGVCGGKVWRNGKVLAKLIHAFPNSLQVGDDEIEDAMGFRGSELLGD
jgi:hypothetical protein